MLDNIVFIGAPGCGKGTQAELLKKEHGYLHVSTGDLFREMITEESEIAKKLKAVLSSGELVSDEMVNSVIDNFYSKNKNAKGMILDGYPRNVEQGKQLESILEKYNAQISKAFYFDIDEDVVIKRVTGRFTCTQCGAIYNEYFNNTKVKDECDTCHSHVFKKRSDDTEEVVKHRLQVFNESTAPLLVYYKDKLVKINADQPLNLVAAEILENL